jgi:hypothetical protein
MKEDILSDKPLPECDLWLCRDFMQHLPSEKVLTLLRKMKASKINWLLLTSHTNKSNEDIKTTGMFRPLNLMADPFNFPEPRISINDGDGRILGLWHRSEIGSSSC